MGVYTGLPKIGIGEQMDFSWQGYLRAPSLCRAWVRLSRQKQEEEVRSQEGEEKSRFLAARKSASLGMTVLWPGMTLGAGGGTPRSPSSTLVPPQNETLARLSLYL